MAPPHTLQLAGRADWALMIAVHDALRRDLDQLLHTTASHASADALPLISQFLSPRELGGIAAAIRGGHSIRRAGTTVPRALTGARPDVREHVLSQLPAPGRLPYRTVWLPRYARTTPPL
jgi:hypothetical protein